MAQRQCRAGGHATGVIGLEHLQYLELGAQFGGARLRLQFRIHAAPPRVLRAEVTRDDDEIRLCGQLVERPGVRDLGGSPGDDEQERRPKGAVHAALDTG